MKPTKEEHEKILLAVSDFLRSRDITHMPIFGTLLGLHREGGIIDGDTDVDLMVLEEDESRLLWASHCLPDGMVAYRCYDPFILSLAFEGSDAYCDLYIFRKKGGGWECGDYSISDDEISGPPTISYMGREFRVPSNISKYLERVYGDWRKPAGDHAKS